MKKLALLILLVATTAIACPNMDSSSDEHAPKTATQDKKDNKTADTSKDSKAKAAPKTEKAPAPAPSPSKDTAKAKTEKPDPKKPANDKVSQK